MTKYGMNSLQVKTGHYVGDGTNNRAISGLTFVPKCVILVNPNGHKYIKTDTMTGNNSKDLSTSDGVATNKIKTLTSDGFTISNDDEVNKIDFDYYYMAYGGITSYLVTGTYTGDGNASQTITLVAGTCNGLTLVLPEEPAYCYYRSYYNNSLSEDCEGFSIVPDAGKQITNFPSTTQFTVVTTGIFNPTKDLNKSGDTFHYVSFAQSSFINSSGYTGDGTSSRTISTSEGIIPELVWNTIHMSADGVSAATIYPENVTLWRTNNWLGSYIDELNNANFVVGILGNADESAYRYIIFEENYPLNSTNQLMMKGVGL